jgi:hypothetical protein
MQRNGLWQLNSCGRRTVKQHAAYLYYLLERRKGTNRSNVVPERYTTCQITFRRCGQVTDPTRQGPLARWAGSRSRQLEIARGDEATYPAIRGSPDHRTVALALLTCGCRRSAHPVHVECISRVSKGGQRETCDYSVVVLQCDRLVHFDNI